MISVGIYLSIITLFFAFVGRGKKTILKGLNNDLMKYMFPVVLLIFALTLGPQSVLGEFYILPALLSFIFLIDNRSIENKHLTTGLLIALISPLVSDGQILHILIVISSTCLPLQEPEGHSRSSIQGIVILAVILNLFYGLNLLSPAYYLTAGLYLVYLVAAIMRSKKFNHASLAIFLAPFLLSQKKMMPLESFEQTMNYIILLTMLVYLVLVIIAHLSYQKKYSSIILQGFIYLNAFNLIWMNEVLLASFVYLVGIICGITLSQLGNDSSILGPQNWMSIEKSFLVIKNKKLLPECIMVSLLLGFPYSPIPYVMSTYWNILISSMAMGLVFNIAISFIFILIAILSSGLIILGLLSFIQDYKKNSKQNEKGALVVLWSSLFILAILLVFSPNKIGGNGLVYEVNGFFVLMMLIAPFISLLCYLGYFPGRKKYLYSFSLNSGRASLNSGIRARNLVIFQKIASIFYFSIYFLLGRVLWDTVIFVSRLTNQFYPRGLNSNLFFMTLYFFLFAIFILFLVL